MLLEIFRQITKCNIKIQSFHDFIFFQISGIIKSLPMQESYHLFPSTASTASTTSVAALASLAGSSGNFVENGGNGGGGGGGILPPHYPPNTRCDYFAIFISRFLKTFSAFSVWQIHLLPNFFFVIRRNN